MALRRAIGLVRLGGDDRSDRDLRLVQGSALNRLLSDKTLRSRIATKLAETKVEEELSDDAKKALEDLDDVFEREKLPDCLELSVTGSPGASIASMIGLTAFLDDDTQLPLSSWGAGTRRLAALTIAEQNQAEHPITVVDEIERGLEPYRQRVLIGKLQSGSRRRSPPRTALLRFQPRRLRHFGTSRTMEGSVRSRTRRSPRTVQKTRTHSCRA